MTSQKIGEEGLSEAIKMGLDSEEEGTAVFSPLSIRIAKFLNSPSCQVIERTK
jgi:hypothetical protein